MNKAEVTIESKGISNTKVEELSEDKFTRLWNKAEPSPTKVSITWGRVGSYGDPKVTVSITLSCHQRESAIDLATYHAYEKAKQIVNDIIEDFEKSNEPTRQSR